MKDFCATVSKTLSESLNLKSKSTGEQLISLPIQEATEEHRNYILSTWVRSYESSARRLVYGPSNGPTIRLSQDSYRSGESASAEAHWKSTKVVTSEDGYTIHAWICAEPGQLWHVYVPPALRGGGVARALVEHYAGKTYMVSKPWPERSPRLHNVTYNPYMTK